MVRGLHMEITQAIVGVFVRKGMAWEGRSGGEICCKQLKNSNIPFLES